VRNLTTSCKCTIWGTIRVTDHHPSANRKWNRRRASHSNTSQQNGKAERANRYIMERVRAALLDAGAEEELWAETISSVIHVLNRSPEAGQDVTPLEALTGRRPDVKGFRVWGSRAWALKPKKQQRKLEPRTDVGRLLGYTVGVKAYRILEDYSNKIFERRDVLMEEIPSKTINKMFSPGSSASPRLKAWTDGNEEDGAMDMLAADVPSGDEYAPQQSPESDGAQDEEAVHYAEDGDGDDAGEDAAPPEGHQELPDSTTESDDDRVQARRRSKRKPAPKVTWWESNPKAYVAAGPCGGAKSSWDLSKPPNNAKEARARLDWPLWKAAEKEEYLAHKKLGNWSKTKNNNKCKAVKTRYVYDIKRYSEGNVTRYKARLVAQGFNQVPGRAFDETWAPVPGSATTRARFAVAEAKDWEVHHVDVKTALLTAKMDKEMYINLPDGTEPGKAHEVFRLNQAPYGTKQAARLWGIKLDKELKAMGAVRSKVDPCLYTWSHPVHGLVYILIYVDDLVVAGKSLDGVQAVKNSVSATFVVRDMGEVKDFISMKVMRDRAAKMLTLSNPGHVIALLEAFGMSNSTPNMKPMVSGAQLSKTGQNLLPDGNRYAELVGSLIYLYTTTRPDIAFAVGVLSRYMACPEEDHMRAAKVVLRYLRGATRLGVAYGADKALQRYVDADWAGDVESIPTNVGPTV